MSNPRSSAHVVILGGGFGGRYAARRLAALLPKGDRITLIDRNSYLLYTPMLTEVAGRSVAPAHILAPSRDLPRRVSFLAAEVQSADLKTRVVTLADGRTLAADHLLLALGSTTNFRDVPGAQQGSVTMKTLDDARRVAATVERNVELASRTEAAEARRKLLTVVVAGGGYTGVETIASINDLAIDTALAHGIPASELNLILVETSEELMAEMPAALRAYGKQQLEEAGIQVRLNTGVKAVADGKLTLSTGETLEPGLLIWDTGIIPNPLVASFDCPRGKKGGILTDSTFRLPQRPGVWALGDCAEIPKPDGSGKFFEPTAQNATREGMLVAHNIFNALSGRKLRPFTYKQVGELALVSRHTGVAFVFGQQITGLAAWLLWRAIYVAKMPGIMQPLRILSDWLRLALSGRLSISTSHALPAGHAEASAGLLLDA